MRETINVNDGARVNIETRCNGRVRMVMDHDHFDVSRCELSPHEAEFLANALMQAVDILRKGAAHPQSFAGRAAAEAPSPGRACVSKPECMDKGCQSGKCRPMSFQPLQNGAAGYSMPGESSGGA